MSRAMFQVLVIPYRLVVDGQTQYLLFRRTDLGVWQWIAGGGENRETPEQTARREAFEEAGIPEDSHLIRYQRYISLTISFGKRKYTCFQSTVSPSKSKTPKFVCPVNIVKARGLITKQLTVFWSGTATKPLCGSYLAVCRANAPNKSIAD